MNKLIVFLLGLSVAVSPSWAAKRHGSHSRISKTSSHRSAQISHSVARHHSRRGKHAKVARHSYGQQAPTASRYQQIQQALSEKGYFKGQVNGQWGPDSVDALKRFQTDQNLTVDGKIGSLSLIALGLGPKRNLSAQATQPAGAATPPLKQPGAKDPPAPPVSQ